MPNPLPLPPQDLAQLRLDNALALFEEFVRQAARHADAAALRGLEKRFAERIQIQPSYWSQIKGRSRQIGERLARQFEQHCQKPRGWLDQVHGAGISESPLLAAPNPAQAAQRNDDNAPRDDDERFIVGLVLTYYRRHPQRARTRLLDLLGEVLTPAPATAAANAQATTSRKTAPTAAPGEDANALWRNSQAGVAPLKPRK